MNAKLFVLVLAFWNILRIATPPVGAADSASSPAPNILLILADDVGDEVLGCYGGKSFSTPRLDRLAAAGMRFRHAYSMPVCHPTRLCLLTGRYPFRFASTKWGQFPAEAESATLAQAMKAAGYATAIAGKWQLTLLKNDPGHPHRLGFDHYCLFGWHEGARYYAPLIWEDESRRQYPVSAYGPDLYTAFLIDFMRANRNRPFFAFYSMALCHDVTDDLEQPVPYGPHGRYDNYGEMVAAMDEQVGRLLDALDELQLRENTLVVFVGDNGTPKRSIIRAENGTYIRNPVTIRVQDREIPGGKGELTDAGTRVPLLVRWPRVVDPRQVTDTLVDFSDFYPTFTALARSPENAISSGDGVSFAPVLHGRITSTRQWAYAESGERYWVRTPEWKRYSTGEFFHVSIDPEEQDPLPAAAVPDPVRQRLEEAIAGIR